MGYIKPLNPRDKENKYHKGVIYRVVGNKLKKGQSKL